MRPVIVLANGCFDPVHPGHLFHFEAAKKFGHILIVSITKDAFVNKGPDRPCFPESHRARMVQALEPVDGVILVENSLEALKTVRPQVFVKGREYENSITGEDRKFCEENNITIAFTDEPTYSSTALLRFYELRRGT